MRNQFSKLFYDFALESLHNYKRVRNAKVNARIRQLEVTQARHSIDWLHVILLLPCVLLFFPLLSPFIVDAFALLEHLPTWYRWVIGLMVLANFGLKLSEKYRI